MVEKGFENIVGAYLESEKSKHVGYPKSNG
jgi:hypothetical protein